MRLGFYKEDITPEIGVELGGYAGYRPCSGIHDPLWCRCLVLEQEDGLYALVQLDLMCADEPFCRQLAAQLEPLGIRKDRVIISAIHTHSAPCGVIPGEGLMQDISLPGYPVDSSYQPYLEKIFRAVYSGCRKAKENLEPFTVRIGQGPVPKVGSERHTGAEIDVMLTALQFRLVSGRCVLLYNFPCHPTVMGPGNLEVTADFPAGIERQLDADMAVFLNGAAGDISTRYTRAGQTFAECERLGTLAAQQIRKILEQKPYEYPMPIKMIRSSFDMAVRQVEPVEEARKRLEELTERVRQAQENGADATTLRTLKSYVEGAGINLQFASSLGAIRQISLDICVISFGGLKFSTVPGELFSALLPGNDVCVIGYANGYNLYIADRAAYDAQYYEALASIFAEGEGERLVEFVNKLLMQLENT